MSKVAVVLGIGPGLGMSVAYRFGAEGFAVGVVSRSAGRHDDHVAELAGRGVEATAFAADVGDPDQLRSALAAIRDRLDEIDVAYYGPGAADLDSTPTDVREATADDVRRELETMCTRRCGW